LQGGVAGGGGAGAARTLGLSEFKEHYRCGRERGFRESEGSCDSEVKRPPKTPKEGWGAVFAGSGCGFGDCFVATGSHRRRRQSVRGPARSSGCKHTYQKYRGFGGAE
jgi:hypothetical protein